VDVAAAVEDGDEGNSVGGDTEGNGGAVSEGNGSNSSPDGATIRTAVWQVCERDQSPSTSLQMGSTPLIEPIMALSLGCGRKSWTLATSVATGYLRADAITQLGRQGDGERLLDGHGGDL
jgi:hypothetical protein